MTEAAADPFTGSDRFTVSRRIGQGAMGVVYEAHDVLCQMPVAIKTIRSGDPTAMYRFKREFRSLSDITHRNLATLYELFAEATPWFFTMELVTGVTFLEYVRRSNSVDYQRLSAALIELVAGLSALHSCKKLHRDVKPSNVLVQADGRVVVLDFGLVMDFEGGSFGTFIERDWFGTAAYMAPEQVTGDLLTEATDWYGVGGILFQALTGKLPFDGDSHAMVVAKIARDGPSPRDINPDTPEAFDRICTQLLRRDPEERLSGQQIVDLFASRPSSAVRTAPSRSYDRPIALVGREAHLAALERAFQRVRRDRSVVMLVHGPSGSGKTALVEDFLDQFILRDDVLVLSGRCYERESVRYKALDSVVDFLSRYLHQLSADQIHELLPDDASLLAELFPVLGSVISAESSAAASIVDPRERRRRAVGAFRALLSRLTTDVRVLICIDDLQWGDLDSALLMTELLGQATGPGLFLIATYRSEDAETSPCLRALLDGPPLPGMERRQLILEPLSLGDARRLACDLLEWQGLDSSAQAAIARESGGSPLFVYELVAYLQGGDGLTELPSSADELTFEYVLRRRLSRVPAETAHLLEIMAVSGQPLLEADAYTAADLPRRDPGILASLRSARLVRTRGSGDATAVEIYHDRIREILVASLDADVRRHCHHRLALTLRASGKAQPDTLAVHFFGAGDFTTAGHYYLTAADAAADAMAFDRAAEYYRHALNNRPVGENSSALRTKRGHALANAGRGWEAAEEFRAAREGANQTAALELERLAGYQYCISGHVEVGRLALCEALGRVGETMPPTPRHALWPLLRDRALLRLRRTMSSDRDAVSVPPIAMARIDAVWSVATGLSQIDLVTAAAFQARNLLLSLRAGEPYRVVRALALEAISCALEGTRRHQRVTALLRAAQEIAARIQQPHALGLVALAEGIAALSCGRWDEGEAALSAAEATFRTKCVGVTWELATLHHFRVWTFAFRGAYAEMMSYGHNVLDEARARNDLYTPSTIGMFVEPIEHLLADDPDGSREALEAVARRWNHRGLSLQRVMEHMQTTFIDLYAGEGKRAWDRLNLWWPELRASHLLRLEQMRIQMFHLRAACALQAAIETGSDRLLESARKDARKIERERAPWAEPEAKTIFAALAAHRGDRSGAAVLLGQAADQFDTLNRGQFAHPARWQQGRLLRGDEGHRLTEAAASKMVEQGVSNTERWVDLHIPGFTS